MFQKTIIKKYLRTQDCQDLQEKWIEFQNHFHNTIIQENIRNSKEEQYQEGFLRDLFVNIFGYTLNPTVGFNLTTELRNIKDAKKADGGIIIEENVVGVIELKGTNTTDLGKVEQQAFNYKNNQTGCIYVITSNFEKLRFYIDDSVTFIEFNLFDLKQDDFNLLYLLLFYENIKNNIPKKIKDESLSQEDTITKKLYKDYSLFKRELFQNLMDLNPEFHQLELFKKTQKLLDRLLFLFFGEDRGLLPPNSVRQILEQWNKLNELDECVPLYNRYKKYFGYLNTGYKGKHHDVFAYNGGLFKADEILDHVKIDDKLLYKHSLKLSEYDFASEVDVNILGHIFENSLNEIDEIKSQLEGKEVDKSKTKRKKDGVFYTPKYITKYIVENTVGKICEEKKTDFGIIEEDYFTDKKRQQKTKENLLKKLDDYREWLLHITIVDPACGSGAFLNEALNFLIEEHQYIDELESKLTGSSISFSYHSESILENNLFGVDLNEESVEIAKLSLWLRTAEPNRKLNSLNDNIKCGNSLIDDPEIAGEKAFKWEDEFPQVFAKGGFDVVIGNPPYGAKIPKEQIVFLSEKYLASGISTNLSDTYFSFYAKSLSDLVKENGVLGFIAPNTWRLIDSGSSFRNYLLNTGFHIRKIVQHSEKVFEDATVDVDTLIICKNSNEIRVTEIEIGVIGKNIFNHSVDQKILGNQNSINLYLQSSHYELIKKINEQSFFVKDYYSIKNGVKPYEVGKGKPPQTKETLQTKPYTSESKLDDTFKPLIGGSSFNRYKILWNNDTWIKYGDWLAAPRDKQIFEVEEKLIFRQTSDKIIGTFIGKGFVMRNNTHIILRNDSSTISLKPLLSLLNSKLVDFYYWTMNPERGEALAEVKAFHLGLLPIPMNLHEENIEKLSQKILSLNKDLQELAGKLQRNLQREFSLETLPKKLQNWDQLSYADFLKELGKQKATLTLLQKSEWEDYFETEKKKVLEIKSQIDATDKEIDQMVYELYGLTEEEIGIIENS